MSNYYANEEFIKDYQERINKLNDKKAKIAEELLEAAKNCYEMEIYRYIEEDIPTSPWMRRLFNAINEYEEVNKQTDTI
jgi:hypothetical protein